MSTIDQVKKRIEDRSARIGIIGLGYVGLPLALRFIEMGFKVCGFDIDGEKVEQLVRGASYIQYISDERIRSALESNLVATIDYSLASTCDALIICVPTPLGRHFEPDLSYVTGTLDALVPFLRNGQILSLESTTYPGTTVEEVVPRVEQSGFKVGENFFVVYSPEREDPGNPDFSTATIPKVVGGDTDNCSAVGEQLYAAIIDQVVLVSSTRVAEMTKLLENIHRSVNIGLMNEMKLVADKMSIDIFEVIRAASTKPFGFTPYYPGPGLGGHCIPIDPYYLTWKAREYGLRTKFIELSGDVNRSMPEFVIQKALGALNAAGIPMAGSKIIVLGVAYKKNIGDIRESPALEIMRLLLSYGADVNYSDPFVPSLRPTRNYDFNMESMELDSTRLKTCDACILVTDHDAFEYEELSRQCRLIVDCRGRFRTADNVIRA
ncbi:nucleotide sugar dehydrogenase [Luminiphilus sp.]|nr:nucleotide sugar dehydrogenase [Luminiphilus sp.]